MSTTRTPSVDSDPAKPALHAGIKEILDASLGAERSTIKLCTKTTALALGESARPDLNLRLVVEKMWTQITANWVEAKCPWRGRENWRWELHKNLGRDNKRREVSLNRRFAQMLCDCDERWANEIPTGSGLVEPGAKSPGGLDFAYCPAPGDLCLIELKVERGENPVSAAFQIVIYALVLNLALHVHERLRPSSNQAAITIAEQWRLAKHADLRVLAQEKYYHDYGNLAWFEDQLNLAVSGFGERQGLPMTFAYSCFKEEPTDEQALLAALARKVPWGFVQ
jgi:hypothetical protein